VATERPARGLEPTNRLVLATSTNDQRRVVSARGLPDDPAADVLLLVVTYTRTPADVVADWRAAPVPTPGRFHVVTVQERPGTDDLPPEAVATTTAATTNPNDLTGLAMRLQDVLSDVDDYEHVLLCFDSVTVLLQYQSVQSAFKFLHMLTSQLREAEVVGNFYVDPTAVDDRTLARVRTVMDEEVELE